jgi:hypothetical protein
LNAQEKKPVAAPVAKPAKKKVVPNKKFTFSDLEKKLHFDKTPISLIIL